MNLFVNVRGEQKGYVDKTLSAAIRMGPGGGGQRKQNGRKIDGDFISMFSPKVIRI